MCGRYGMVYCTMKLYLVKVIDIDTGYVRDHCKIRDVRYIYRNLSNNKEYVMYLIAKLLKKEVKSPFKTAAYRKMPAMMINVKFTE